MAVMVVVVVIAVAAVAALAVVLTDAHVDQLFKSVTCTRRPALVIYQLVRPKSPPEAHGHIYIRF